MYNIPRIPWRLLPITRKAAATEAPAHAFQVVRSSCGRLRVHFPHWSGDGSEAIVNRLRRFAGVTHAEANGLTGNILILFQPGQTSVSALTAELDSLCPRPAAMPAPPAVACGRSIPGVERHRNDVTPSQPARRVVFVTGTRRVVYKVLGWSSVGMAVVGAIMPGIPTAPFVILAGYFFGNDILGSSR